MTDLPPPPPPETHPPASRDNPAVKAGLAIVALGLVFAGWSALSDRFAPSTSRAAISAYVAQIGPRVSGRVTSVDVEDNAVVEARAALFHIDPQPFELAVAQARAALQQATQSIDASSAQLAATQAQVAQARANYELVKEDADRARQLVERGLLSRAKADAALTQEQTAKAALDAALAQSEAAQKQLGVAGADNPQVLAAQLKLEQAEYDLLSTTVTAPRLGVVTNLNLTVGQFLAAGTPALTFIDADAVWITADLRENQLGHIEPGDVVGLAFDADPGRIYPGRVQSLGWGIAPNRPQAGGLPVNTSTTQWFEPARKMPVRITLDGGMDAFPKKARLGGKVDVVIYAEGTGNPVAWVAMGLQRLRSLASVFY